ncbi:unnamed protein product [Closterium sp. NIES-54]
MDFTDALISETLLTHTGGASHGKRGGEGIRGAVLLGHGEGTRGAGLLGTREIGRREQLHCVAHCTIPPTEHVPPYHHVSRASSSSAGAARAAAARAAACAGAALAAVDARGRALGHGHASRLVEVDVVGLRERADKHHRADAHLGGNHFFGSRLICSHRCEDARRRRGKIEREGKRSERASRRASLCPLAPWREPLLWQSLDLLPLHVRSFLTSVRFCHENREGGRRHGWGEATRAGGGNTGGGRWRGRGEVARAGGGNKGGGRRHGRGKATQARGGDMGGGGLVPMRMTTTSSAVAGLESPMLVLAVVLTVVLAVVTKEHRGGGRGGDAREKRRIPMRMATTSSAGAASFESPMLVPAVVRAMVSKEHGSVGQPASVASDGVVRHDGDDEHDTTHPKATNAARSQHRVSISAPTDDSALPSPMPLKAQRPPCFDPSQWGGPTVQAWLLTLNVFFDTNYVSEDTAKIHYAVSLLRGPAIDWWRIIVTKPMEYATLPTREGQTGPWALSYFVEVPQYRT